MHISNRGYYKRIERVQPVWFVKSKIPDGRSETSPKSECEADCNEVKSAAAMSVKEFQESKTGAV